MSSASLDGLRLKKACAALRSIEQEIKEKQKWMTTLMSFKGNPTDARHLLEICVKIMQESMTLERVVDGLRAEAKSLSRSIPSMPPKQLTLSKYSPSSLGELKELSALTGRMPKQLADLRAAVVKFRAFATDKMNDPERTSDGQVMDPGGLFLAFLELFLKARNI
jgi:hypothetical protein